MKCTLPRLAVACLFAAGCVARSGPSAEAPAAGGSSGDAPRRPDAVVVERAPALPVAADRAEAKGVVALREPVEVAAIVCVVRQLVDAWQHGSPDELSALLSRDSDVGPMTARERGRSALTESWKQRLQAHELTRLKGVELVRPERIEHWTWEDLGGAGAPPRPVEMRPGELLVRVPVEQTRVAGDKLFGDAILMILRRENGELRIVAYEETDE